MRKLHNQKETNEGSFSVYVIIMCWRTDECFIKRNHEKPTNFRFSPF